MLIDAFLIIHAFFFVMYLCYRLIKRFRCPRWASSSSGSDVPLQLFSESHQNYYRFLLGQNAMNRLAQQHASRQQDQCTLPSSGPSTSPTQQTTSPIKDLSDVEAQPGPSSSASTSKDLQIQKLFPRALAKFASQKAKVFGKKEKASSEEKTDSSTQRSSRRRGDNGKTDNDSAKVDSDKEKSEPDTKPRVAFEETAPAAPPSTSTGRLLPTVQWKGKFGPNTKPKGGAKRNTTQTPPTTTKEELVGQPSEEQPPEDLDVVSTQPLPRSRLFLHRQSTTSVEPLTSTESAAQTTEADLYFFSGSSERRYVKKSLFSSLDSVKSLTDDGVDLPLHYSSIGRRQPQFYKGISNLIDPRIRQDILNSVPVCSQKVEPKPIRKLLPSVHYCSKKVAFRRQLPVLDDIREAPPSPAPSTPVLSERLLYEDESRTQRRPKVSLNTEDQSTKWTHKEFKKGPVNKQKRATFAPRLVVIHTPVAAESAAEDYSLYDHRASPAYRPSLHGDPSPTQPYNHPEPPTPGVNLNQSFARDINNRYHSNDRDNFRRSGNSAMMNSLEDHERKIIIEFCHLLEKSKQLFNGLRELPQYGHKQWSLYFGRTFDIYTRLWKYQQQHRAVLDSKYGMKRWQIGEIASKIGQLYYHFYLRTSETAYLNEAFSFYYAIRGRCYYTKANKEDKCELMVKKLRYYARFIVVCLLLNKMKLVKELIKELERQIIEYGNTYDPDDQVEWTVVVDEVKAFIHAEPVVSIVNSDNQTMILSHRLSPLMTPPVERSPQMNLSLQEILIVGSSSQQVKFSELTMDMFRMLQTLEREPSGDIQHIFDESPRQRFMSTPSAQNQEGVESGQKTSNPHKYLLFKPSPTQMLVYLSSATNDLPPNGALLLYISADGYVGQNGKHPEDATWGYDLGGLITTSKNDIYRECSKDPKSSTASKYKELQCFYPGDLYPYTRRPLFLIVDSDNSYAFQNIPRHFGQPLVILMSPLDMPPSYHDPRRQGSLFTLFLHSPLEGICYCCDLSSVSLALWDRAQMLLDTFMAEASNILVRSRIDPTYIAFMGDDFFRLLLLRFVFCEAVLRLHRLFRGRTHRTRCSPVMPDELFEHPTLVHIILDIANVLQIRNHIHDPSVANAPSGPMPSTN